MNLEVEHFTNNHLIDIDDQNMLMQLAQFDTLNCFDVGDIVNRNYDQAVRNGWHKPVEGMWTDYVTKDRICSAAGSFYGKSARTMRYYADVAGFFPKGGIRDDYIEVLSFSHFAKARKYDNWLEYLKYAIEGGKGGEIVSVDGCEAEWARRLKEKHEQESLLQALKDYKKEDVQQTESDQESEPQVEEAVNPYSFPNRAGYAMQVLAGLLVDPEIPRKSKNKLYQAVELIKEAVAEFSKPVVK